MACSPAAVTASVAPCSSSMALLAVVHPHPQNGNLFDLARGSDVHLPFFQFSKKSCGIVARNPSAARLLSLL